MAKRKQTSKKETSFLIKNGRLFDLDAHQYTLIANAKYIKGLKGVHIPKDESDEKTLFGLVLVGVDIYSYFRFGVENDPVTTHGSKLHKQGKKELINIVTNENSGGFYVGYVDVMQRDNDSIFKYLLDLISFESGNEAIVSCNILAYMFTNKVFSSHTQEVLTYEWVKEKLTYFNKGIDKNTLFFEPYWIPRIIDSICKARGSYNLLPRSTVKIDIEGKGEVKECEVSITDSLINEFNKLSNDDPDVLQYQKDSQNPMFRFPNGKTPQDVESIVIPSGPLFQTPIEPDKDLVVSYDETLQ